MKKKLTMCLSVALIAVMAICGTLAYLTSEDGDVNVMTLGNVEITQHEYQRAENEEGKYITKNIDERESYVLEAFEQGKPLMPAVIPNGGTINGVKWDYDEIPVRMSQVDSHGGANVFNTPNAQDKFVTVENTGKSDAYVRTLVAFEVGTATIEDKENYPNEPLISSEIRAEKAEKNTTGAQPWTYGYSEYVTIDGNNYMVYELVYTGAKTSSGWKHENGVLPAGETTYPNLCQVYLASRATNEDVEKLDGNKNGAYDILVLSQAVQVEGFDNAQEALNVGFGEANAVNVAKWFETMETPELVEVTTLGEMNEALKEAAENDTPVIIDAQGNNLGDFYYDAKFTDGSIIKNAKFTYFYGGNVTGTVTFENCEFVSDHSYSANFDSGNGNIIFNNCLFDGWNSFGTAITGVEMNHCTFQKTYDYGILRFYQDAQLYNCTFADSFEGIDTNVTGTVVHINNCKGIDGKIYNNEDKVGVWFVDGVDVSDQITSW